MIRLSNHGTLNLKTSCYYVCGALPIALVILNIIVLTSDFDVFSLYFIIPTNVILIAGIVFAAINTKRLNQAFCDSQFLYIKGYSKSDKVELSKIKNVKYLFWFIIPFFERPFVIKLSEPSIFGKRIYVYPTNLDENKKIKANLNRKGLLEEMVNKNRV